jgi:hypothetical protein
MHQEVEPDQRTGAASKADRSTLWNGEHVLQLPPCTASGPVAQQQERLALNQEGDGANPSGVANFDTSVAQCIEHRASNAEVAGESPAGSAIPFPGVAQQQRHSAQTGASAGATPAAGTIHLPA